MRVAHTNAERCEHIFASSSRGMFTNIHGASYLRNERRKKSYRVLHARKISYFRPFTCTLTPPGMPLICSVQRRMEWALLLHILIDSCLVKNICVGSALSLSLSFHSPAARGGYHHITFKSILVYKDIAIHRRR